MKRTLFLVVFALVAGISVCRAEAAPGKASAASAPEYRAIWVTRFEWADASPETCRTTIRQVMKTLAENNFNAVFFQVRGQGDVLYPSPFEVWSPMLGGGNPGWDPLEFALDEAHKNGLEFHAYINSNTCWFSKEKKLPEDPKHLFYKHCNAGGGHDWLICDENGEPVQWDDNYVWIAPGVPDFQAYFREVVVDLATRYDVDGIHIDRIRVPGPEYSHDRTSMIRYTFAGNPDKLGFEDWTRDQFTRLLNDVYGNMSIVRPKVKISVTPIGLYDQSRYPSDGYDAGLNYGRTRCYQDAQVWLKSGVVDFAVPQIYWPDGGKKPDFSEVLRDWMLYRGDRSVVSGMKAETSSVRELIDQIRRSRMIGTAGQCVFSWTGISERDLKELKAGPYTAPAPVPEFSWKTEPTTGMIVGWVTDKGGEPITDVRIKCPAVSERVSLSSGDGFFAVLNLPPGSYDVEFSKGGYDGATEGPVEVKAGIPCRMRTTLTRKEQSNDKAK